MKNKDLDELMITMSKIEFLSMRASETKGLDEYLEPELQFLYRRAGQIRKDLFEMYQTCLKKG